jgi:SAM-dependent methyltransferase
MLHRLNPARLAYIREVTDAHFHGDGMSFAPLVGRTALDVGCGAGLLVEPLARLGAKVTGLDAAPENIGAARTHAAATGLEIEYIAGGIEDLPGRRFDLVTSMEVIEHVANPAAFVAGLADALAPGGLMILSTPNRTALSRLGDDHARRRHRRDSQGHARLEPVPHARRADRIARRRRAEGRRPARASASRLRAVSFSATIPVSTIWSLPAAAEAGSEVAM